MTGPQAVSLFAGVGGFERAFANLGVPAVASVEIDKAARGVLADHFPETTLMTDVTEVTGDDLRAAGFDPRRGILTAGWPCQGNSVAGRRGGMDDPRSGLWRHVVRLLAETRPRWFFGENVPGLLSVNGGRDFGRVVNDLGELGYGLAWRVLDAQYIGVPQRRRRVLIVGHLGDGSTPAEVLLEPEGGGRDSAPRRAPRQVVAALTRSSLGGGGADDNNGQAGHLIPFDAAQITSGENRSNPRPGDPAPTLADTGRPMVAETLRSHPRPGSNSNGAIVPIGFAWQAGGNNDASGAHVADGTPTLPRSQTLAVLAPTLTAGMGTNVGHPGDAGKDDIVLAVAQAGTQVRRLTPLECERLQGYPDGWTATSWGKPQADAPRYRQMGNSVAVPVIEWVARRLLAADEAARAA
jgi:DNA (cytosine-5)-methyltransferase 1